MLVGKFFKFQQADPPGTSTPPQSDPPVTPPAAAATEVAEHVQQAATSATEAAQQSGQDGWKTVADELKGLRGDIKELMNKTSQAATPPLSPSTSEPPATPPAPDVNVEVPKPPERKIRRNGRKVTRRG